ncbi:hypothetical protein JL721_6578 [Aureococcus anophagefferens]|nr:hypothetical protein JL721_6578 [Aureococcus anophagefferens]
MRAWYSIIIFFVWGLAPKASGQELAKLLASDAAAGDWFGYSVAVSGDLVVVGAYGNADAGRDSGSAYVFRTTNGGASWTQVAKLVASDAAADDWFGYSVAVSGDLVVVGALWNDDAGSGSGSAYVFRTTNDGASWTQVAKLVASDAAAGDSFGSSVAVSGDLVVVEDAGSDSGSAYVFRTTNDGASWTQVAKLVASDAAAGDYFGDSVAISGDLVVVGADNNYFDGEQSGSVYVFRTTNDGASWTQSAKLVASDAAAGDSFGSSVAVSGDLVVVGAKYNDAAGSWSGSAYVFRTTNDGASWTETAKLVASDAAAVDSFGSSVAVSGDLVVVGAKYNDAAGSWSGSAYVFRTTNDGASWTETAKLVACDAAAYDYFGTSVAVSGDLVVVGADKNNDAGSDSGSAYVFRTTNGAVTPTCGSSTASGVNMIVVAAAVVAAVVAVAIVCVYIKRRRTKAAAARADFNVEAPPDRDDAFAGDGLETRSVKELKAEAQIQASTGASNVAGAARHSASTKTPVPSAPPASASFAAASTKTPATKTPAPSARYQQLMRESEGVVARGMTAARVLLAAGRVMPVIGPVCEAAQDILHSVEEHSRKSDDTPFAIAEVVENAHVPDDELLIEMREMNGEVRQGLAQILVSHRELLDSNRKMQQGHATLIEEVQKLTKWERARRLKRAHMEDNEIKLDFIEPEPFAGGGQGSVHKAEYGGETVCLKKFLLVGVGAQSARDKILSSFKKEVGIMVKLRKHPRTVDIVGICTTDASYLGIVTQYLPNGSLRDVLDARGDAITSKMQLIWAKDIAIGMAYLHEEGVLHRDLKCQNVLLTNEWRGKITDFGITLLADVVEVRQFPEGAAVVTEGDDADGMYFLKEGSCSVKQAIPEGEREEGSTETERILRILKKGAYFGECALLNDDKRTASIEAVTATTTAFVGKANFVSLLGAIHGELLSRSPTRPSRRLSKSASDSKFAAAAASPKYAPKPESMQIVKPLGAGAFARVNMVRDASTRRLYALKIISKEKQALEECNHPFVLSLVSAYQDREHVYLLVEPCLGGELFGLKAEYEKGMPEDLAKFYVASVTLAFQHIHALDYVYRDLKPENILIDAQGFAKGVNQAGDWWGSASSPTSSSRGSMRNLIKGFVTKNVAGRLGYQKGGAEDVVKHAFFEDFDFDGLVNKTLAPPWRPKLKKADDTSYFDQEAMADCLEGHDLDAQEKLTSDEEEQWRPVFDQLGPYIKSSPDSPPGVNRSMLKEAL